MRLSLLQKKQTIQSTQTKDAAETPLSRARLDLYLKKCKIDFKLMQIYFPSTNGSPGTFGMMSTPETAITGDTLLSKPKRHGGSAVPECGVMREWSLLQERMTKFALLEKIDALIG